MAGERFDNAAKALKSLKQKTCQDSLNLQRDQQVPEDHDSSIQNGRRRHNYTCIPIPQDHDQEEWFAKLDRNQIWERVFKYVTNPSDVTNAYLSCEMFKMHLEPKVFGSKLNHSQFPGFRTTSSAEESREILRRRLVSKSMKISVDSEFLVPLKFSEYQPIWHPQSWDWSSPMVCRFKHEMDVLKAMEKLQNPSSCASLLRLLVVNDENCDDRDVFYSRLDEFLTVHGGAVWGLQFSQKRLQGRHDFNYERLCNIVSRMPHLIALRIDDFWSSSGQYNEQDQREFNQATARVSHVITARPFPTVPTLKLVQFNYSPDLNESLVSEILNKSVNLEAIWLGRWFCEQPTSAIPPIVRSAMENLRLEYFKIRGTLIRDDLRQLVQFNWPLKFLLLQNTNENFQLTAWDIMTVLNNFSESIVEFSLTSSRTVSIDCKHGGAVEIDFPHLRKIDFPDDLMAI